MRNLWDYAPHSSSTLMAKQHRLPSTYVATKTLGMNELRLPARACDQSSWVSLVLSSCTHRHAHASASSRINRQQHARKFHVMNAPHSSYEDCGTTHA